MNFSDYKLFFFTFMGEKLKVMGGYQPVTHWVIFSKTSAKNGYIYAVTKNTVFRIPLS